MADEEQCTQTQPFSIDSGKFDAASEELWSAYRSYIEDHEKALARAFDTNKQIESFYERLLLIDLGILGLSVTALISTASRFGYPGFHRHTVLTLVVIGWGCLLFSTLSCRAVMMECLKANRKLFDEWHVATSDFHKQGVALIAKKMAASMSGSITSGELSVDFSKLISNIGTLVDPMDASKAIKKLLASLSPPAPQADISTGWLGIIAIWSMELGLIFLGITAIVLLSSFK